MIGDGCVIYYPKHKVYGIEITGNATEEKDYYAKIAQFMKKEFSLNPQVYVRKMKVGKGLKLISYSKSLAEFLMDLGIEGNKTYTAKIPDHLMSWDKAKGVLRGIFETDGCLYFSKSKVTTNKPTYPRLEITTVSTELSLQIIQLLQENGFLVQSHRNRNSVVIYLSGVDMLHKWINEIGFSSAKNWSKYLLWEKLGYYIPRISLPERVAMLGITDT